MHFIDILRHLSDTDLEKFELFLHSPYFYEKGCPSKRDKDVYEYLMKNLWEKYKNTLDRDSLDEEIKHTFFPSRGQIRVTYSNLKKMLLKYIAIEHRQNKKFQDLFAILNFFEKTNGLEEGIAGILTEIERELPQDIYSSEDLYYKFLWAREKYSHYLTIGTPREYTKVFLTLLTSLKQHIAIRYIQYALEVQNKEDIYKDGAFLQYFPLNLLYRILTLIENNPHNANVPIVQLYYFLGKCLLAVKQIKSAANPKRIAQFEHTEREAYQNLERLLFMYMKKAKNNEYKEDIIYAFLATRNYLIRKALIDTSNKYLLKMGNLNAKAENTGLFLEKGLIAPTHYLNNVKTGIYIAVHFRENNRSTAERMSYQYLSNYIEKNYLRTPEKHRDFLQNLVQAWFYVNECSALCPVSLSQKFIHNIGRANINTSIELSRRVVVLQLEYMLLRDTFELHEKTEPAAPNKVTLKDKYITTLGIIETECRRFLVFLQDNKTTLSEDNKTGHESFITAIMHLTRMTEKKMYKEDITKAKENLLAHINASDSFMVEKKWVLAEHSKL